MTPWIFFYGLFQLLGWPLFVLPLFSSKRRPLARKRLSPPSTKLTPPVIWIHALSVGEIQAALPLIKGLKKEIPRASILFTVTTTTGFEFAQRFSDFDLLWPGPVDLLWVSRKFVQKIDPSVFILVETDLWPGITWALKRHNTLLFFANAALSEKALRRMKRLKPLSTKLYSAFHFIASATRADQKRLQSLLPGQNIRFLGNLKFDQPAPSPQAAEELKKALLPHLKRPIIVCGSTHRGEEKLWLKTFKLFHPPGSLIICPRDPSRAGEIVSLAQSFGFSASLRSQPKPCEILVVDTMGELRLLYALADVAFVGGTLVPIGGHNLLEPLLWCKPVLYGPYVESISELAEEIEDAKAGLFLSPKPSKMLIALKHVLSHKEEFGKAGIKVVREHQGATKRYTLEIKKALQGHNKWKKFF